MSIGFLIRQNRAQEGNLDADAKYAHEYSAPGLASLRICSDLYYLRSKGKMATLVSETTTLRRHMEIFHEVGPFISFVLNYRLIDILGVRIIVAARTDKSQLK